MKNKKKIFVLFIIIITFILSIIIVFSIYYIQWNRDKKEIYYKVKSLNGTIKNRNFKFFKPFSIKIYDRNNKLISEIFNKKQSYVEIEKFPPFIIDLVLLKEDKNFFKHKGIDVKRLIKAILIDILYLKPLYGGSTITQQVSKLLFFNLHKTIKRKIFEIFTSFYIEKILTKKEILEIYLNIVNLGFGRYGFNSASLFYFGKNVWELDFKEGVMLVSILSAPEKYSPLKDVEKTKVKYKMILNFAVKSGLIEQSQVDKIFYDFFKNYNFSEVFNKEYIYDTNRSNWIMRLVINYIKKIYSLQKAFIGNYQVYTTFDLNIQQIANTVINNYFKLLYRYKGEKYREDINKLEIAYIVVNPKNGEIISMIGGRRFSPLNEFNRAIKSKRQIGSIIKPFLYSYAIKENKISPLTMIEDAPIQINLNGKIWSPKNYGNKYYGLVPVYKALQKSLNSVSVRISKMIDLNGFIKYFSKFFGDKSGDITKRLKPYPSIVLGSFEFSPIELAQAYSVFANGGYSIKPFFIKKIVSGNNVIYDNETVYEGYKNIDYKYNNLKNNNIKNNNMKNEKNGKNVIKNELAKIIVNLLSFPLKEGGTAYRAKINNNYIYPIYGKTGTTNNYKDSWFAGFTKNIVSICWIGYERGTGKLKLTGGGYAADLSIKIMKKIYPLFPGDIDFKGKNIKFVRICKITQKLANKNCPSVTILLDVHDIPYEHCKLHKNSIPEINKSISPDKINKTKNELP